MPTAAPTRLLIYFKTYDGRVEELEVDLVADTVDDIKRRIDEVFGIPPSAQIIKHKEDGYSLWGEGVGNRHTLVLYTVAPSAAPTSAAPTQPQCSNGKRDGSETGLDCGGGQCDKCASTRRVAFSSVYSRGGTYVRTRGHHTHTRRT